MDLRYINLNKSDWTLVRKGVFRKAISGDSSTMALHKLMPGHEPMPHSHPEEQIAYIISGTADFNVDGKTIRLDSGGVIVIPPNATHFATVVGDEPVLNLDIFSPSRPSYDTSN